MVSETRIQRDQAESRRAIKKGDERLILCEFDLACQEPEMRYNNLLTAFLKKATPILPAAMEGLLEERDASSAGCVGKRSHFEHNLP